MTRRWIIAALALCVAAWSIWALESVRAGLTITDRVVAGSPVTTYSDGSNGPTVVMAHGFAGSKQMMMGYATVLAQAGYTVQAFDFEGHGRHTTPMGGDVNALDGTTQRLIDQTLAVIEGTKTGAAPVALVGHSMATDVLVRVAQARDDIGPLVLISAFSQAIDATHPETLLLIPGAWEAGLRGFAADAVAMVDPDVPEGAVAQAGDVTRQSVPAPWAEHVAVLHSRVGRAAALDWLNAAYGRAETAPAPPTGWAILGLLGAATALFLPLARLIPQRVLTPPAQPIPRAWFAAMTLGPAAITPFIATALNIQVLPVLVADYLAVHLAVYGMLQGGALLYLRGAGWLGRPSPVAITLLVVWALGVFGLALDRYGASFVPNAPRVPIVAALILGAVPFMLADAALAYRQSLLRRVLARAAFLASLILAIALDFEGLFFLAMIAPVIVLFWLTFGTMGRALAHRVGASTAGLGLGLVLAWSLGVTFPLFQG